MPLRKARAVSLLLAGLPALPALSSCGESTENADGHNESAPGSVTDSVHTAFPLNHIKAKFDVVLFSFIEEKRTKRGTLLKS